MKLTISRTDVNSLLCRQLTSLFPLDDSESKAIEDSLDVALGRCETSFSRIKNKYYCGDDGTTRFDPLHGCQWAAFLYYLSNSMWRMGGGRVSEKVYALNKMLSSADLFYQVDLPDVFMFDHPLGTVLGRAKYGNYFCFSQGCTVGNNKGVYPEFGESVFMMSDSKVIGNCHIGDNVIISAGAYLKDVDIPSGSIVFGQSPNLTVKTDKLEYVRNHAETVFDYD